MENVKRNELSTGVLSKGQFSPVGKLVSPKQSQGRNLTGTARQIRDLAADIHASVQQWNTIHLEGVSILKNITQEKQDESYSQRLQELCDTLENICDELDDVVKRLGQIAHQMKVIALMDHSVNKLFMTWPVTKFGYVAELIYNAYSHEVEVKRSVLENVAHYHTESWKMLFLATWVHQPVLPESLTSLLESLLVETGLRQL